MPKKRFETLYKVSFLLIMSVVVLGGIALADFTISHWSAPLTGGDTLTVGHVNDFYETVSTLISAIHEEGGNIGIGTSSISSDLTLDVEGKIGAESYCDADGNDCFTKDDLLDEESFKIPCSITGDVPLMTEFEETVVECYSCCYPTYCDGACEQTRYQDVILSCDGTRVVEVRLGDYRYGECACSGSCHDPYGQ